jgi:hypothetical protein
VLAFKNKSAKLLRATATTPSAATVDKLSRNLWQFGEQIRLATLMRADTTDPKSVPRKAPGKIVRHA